ncbi:MAG TPA: 16S rRNA (guanine(966)-N(2))-methyltransferase RsmD [Casimicrobiaceae bacterium]|nr:16S rRNA (guanine(966)-N(2))-methyltransferase RsmD [Casimicrobiaceae bacterium]
MKFYAAPSERLSSPLPPRRANTVRIIGGRCRGRVIRFPPTHGLRPTPDRVRETLFNWLGQDLSGRTTLELFAGSGALSLESLSRGASLAVAVDADGDAVRALQENVALLGMSRLEAHRADATAFLLRESRRFDVIYLDPPYVVDVWDAMLTRSAELVTVGGFIYAEASRPLEPPAALSVVRAGRAGRVVYHLMAPVARS